MPVVLIVDDNKLNQLVAAGCLRKLGMDTEIVDSGEKALDAFKARQFDAVLTDIMMPGMDGYELTAHIRDINAAREVFTPVIGVSARAMEGDRENALLAGLDDYLTKPLRQPELEACLNRWLAPTIAVG
jgi:CheY-like chemotaxis protein